MGGPGGNWGVPAGPGGNWGVPKAPEGKWGALGILGGENGGPCMSWGGSWRSQKLLGSPRRNGGDPWGSYGGELGVPAGPGGCQERNWGTLQILGQTWGAKKGKWGSLGVPGGEMGGSRGETGAPKGEIRGPEGETGGT